MHEHHKGLSVMVLHYERLYDLMFIDMQFSGSNGGPAFFDIGIRTHPETHPLIL
jgi:hypothetical protein